MSSRPTPNGTLTLADGRVLAWDECGPADAAPVFYMHGVPACRIIGSQVAAAAVDAQVRVIAPDRPGCGLSSFQPGRRMTDWPADVAALADHLGFDRYWIVGASGGGPYALACAASGDPRLVRTAVTSGIGPLDTEAARSGLYETNRALFEVAAQGAGAVLPALQSLTSADIPPEEAMAALMASLSPADQRVLAEHPEVLAELRDMFAAAVVNGSDGLAYDTWLITQPWGFDLASIAGPVDFYAGDHDHNVPLQHVVDQAAAVPRSSLTVWPESGHTACVLRLPEVLPRLVAAD